ncbi:hypothetical protein H4582DRAFT_2072125 [Lactarius indigo]|nr:hypothetical protein H4582DRAFT_2072125 [Lactarius indigo]
MSSQPSLSCVEQPMKAYVRAFKALERLRGNFEAWRDFVVVFRNLQRCLLELSAFVDWWKDVHAGDAFQPSLRAPTRGAIFEDKHLYANHARWSVAAYILVPKSTFALDLAREVVLAPRKLCSTQPMSLQPLFHSLHQWYYPPLVDDVMANLETAARGYLKCLDTFRPTKGFKRTLDKIENKKNDEARCMAKKARMSMTSQIPRLESVELRCLTDAGAAPEWFLKAQDVWLHAMSHVSHLELASSASPRRFYIPPIHLFWGGNEENQRIYYYHFHILRHEIREWPMRDLPPLTTSEWRSILGNSYWKRQLPNRDSPSPDETFDPNVFWKYGGPLFFGDQQSADVAAGRYKITTSLPCHCDVQMTMVDDTNIRQVVLYYLNSYHAFEEVKEMERIQFPATFEKRWKDQEMFIYMIVEMWDAAGGGTNFKFFDNKEVWRNWLWAVCEVAMGWDGVDSWDWGGFSNTPSRFDASSNQSHVTEVTQPTKLYHDVLRLRACLSLLMGTLTTDLALHIEGYPKATFAGIFCGNTSSPLSSSHSWSSSLHLEKCLVKQKIEEHEITLQVLKEQMSNIEESVTSTTFMVGRLHCFMDRVGVSIPDMQDHIAASIFLPEVSLALFFTVPVT